MRYVAPAREAVDPAVFGRPPLTGWAEFAELLEAAGVDSPAELAQRNAANLAQTFQELDAARPNTVRRVPSETVVAGWIAEARTMERAVSH